MKLTEIAIDQYDEIIRKLKTEFVALTITLAAKKRSHLSYIDNNAVEVIRQGINDVIAQGDWNHLQQLRGQWRVQLNKHKHPGLFKRGKNVYKDWDAVHGGKALGYSWLLNRTAQ